VGDDSARQDADRDMDEAAAAVAAADAEATELRDALGIRVKGSHPPRPAATFEEIGEAAMRSKPYGDGDASAGRVWLRLAAAVESSAYKEPTAVQMQAIPAMLDGRDVLASAPTGSGKTAAFLLPILTRLRGRSADGPRAVILAPTRELVQQIAREGRKFAMGTGIRVAELSRGAAFGAYGAAKAASAADDPPAGDDDADEDDADAEDEDGAVVGAKGGAPDGRKAKAPKRLSRQAVPSVDVLVTTPQRLAWLVASAASASASAPAPALPHCCCLVLDEADRLLRRGDASGLAAVDAVLSACPASAQRAMFSATVHAGVEEAAATVLRDAVTVTVGKPMAAAAGVRQRLVFVGREEGKLLELRQMAREGFEPPVLVFFQDKERADDACHELGGDGVRCAAVHAGKPPAEREDAIRRFRSGDVWMLLATEVVARGLDFRAVRTVVNFDIPTSTSEYVHRVGRTGRAGRTGTAITLFTEADFPLLRPIANVAKLSGAEVPPWMLTLAKPSGRRRAAVPKRRAVSKAMDKERYEGRQRRRELAARKAAKKARRAAPKKPE